MILLADFYFNQLALLILYSTFFSNEESLGQSRLLQSLESIFAQVFAGTLAYNTGRRQYLMLLRFCPNLVFVDGLPSGFEFMQQSSDALQQSLIGCYFVFQFPMYTVNAKLKLPIAGRWKIVVFRLSLSLADFQGFRFAPDLERADLGDFDQLVFFDKIFGTHALSNRRNELPQSHFIIIVMAQVADYFNRFYNTLLRQHLQDPSLHSEWLYFLSMFKSEPFDQSRIDLYLKILVSENSKKVEARQTERAAVNCSQNRSKIRCSRQPSITISELKFEKRLSENIPNPYLRNFQLKFNVQPLQARKMASAQQDAYQKHSLNSASKDNEEQKEEPIRGIQLRQSPNLNECFANIDLNKVKCQIKQQRLSRRAGRHKKLKQISNRLVRQFETNSKLRA